MSTTPQYCNLCKRNVVPAKDFNWLLFIFLCGCVYLPFYFMAEKKCPICKGTQFGPAKADELGSSTGSNSSVNVSIGSAQPAAAYVQDVQQPTQGVDRPKSTTAFCPECGATVGTDSAFCGECGGKL